MLVGAGVGPPLPRRHLRREDAAVGDDVFDARVFVLPQEFGQRPGIRRPCAGSWVISSAVTTPAAFGLWSEGRAACAASPIQPSLMLAAVGTKHVDLVAQYIEAPCKAGHAKLRRKLMNSRPAQRAHQVPRPGQAEANGYVVVEFGNRCDRNSLICSESSRIRPSEAERCDHTERRRGSACHSRLAK